MANALVDYFLQIDGVEGESTDQQYPGLIQIQSWQWAEENSGRGASAVVVARERWR